MSGAILLILIVVLVFLAIASGPIVKVRVEHDEWTAFENGVPTHGVGPRGFWTASRTHGGPFPYEQRPDGSWYNPKTGEPVVSRSLAELLEESSDRRLADKGGSK